MHSTSRQLCALFCRMAVSPTNQRVQAPPQNNKVAPSDGCAGHDSVWNAKADVELGAGLVVGNWSPSDLGLACLLSCPDAALPHRSEGIHVFDNLCPQVRVLTSASHAALFNDLDEGYASTELKLKVYESLGGAALIDVCPVVQRTKVNTYTLVYEWKGTNDSIKPLFLAARLDAVPVNPATCDEWMNPPYSGYLDLGKGKTAIESLPERGFVHSCTVLLAFGIDEERGDHTGASPIGKYLLEMYGPNSIAMINTLALNSRLIGEYADMSGRVFTTPAVAEQGLRGVRMDMLTPGGGSSKPPKHTGTGEAYYQGLEYRAKYDEGFPASLREFVQQSQTSDEKLRGLGDRLLEFDSMLCASSGTTQVIDLVGGGVKVDALPESGWAVLDGRFTTVTAPITANHNATLEAFGKLAGTEGPSLATIRRSGAFGSVCGSYELLSGTIISTLQTNLRTDDFPTSDVVSPGFSTGKPYMHNSDTRHYWDLTKHIFRYNHRRATDGYNGVRTINEAAGSLEQMRFLTRLSSIPTEPIY
ncbi:hypothetical protein PAXRUDRAFT_33217 [Paxillus rubicundulus Ve08.2h10]|uniref:Uncharacterized protein n=1 Tax=Paxillus rubicundulus Ve08.2h10 TaxID=930991 RepID=A0A0D0E2T1_9AGAM|nr:hypothetical protein PAXRUDRAFT_33217 [Paxillus rubicundulus Ve08.2h10]